MDELGPHERRLLAALQEDDSPTLKDSDRIKERVLLSVSVAAAAGLVSATGLSSATGASMAAAPGAAAATTAAATGTAAVTGTAATSGVLAGKAAIGAGLWKALLVVGATAGLGGGAYLATSGNLMQSSAQPGQQSAAEDGVVNRAAANHSSAAKEPSGVSARTPLDAEQEEGALAEVAPSVSVPRTLKKAEGTTATHLKQEAALLQRAQAALQNGNPQGALTALAEHKSKYPRGVLAGEREAAFSVAYCNAGDLVQGRARAQAFIKRNPASPMVQRLQAACKLPSE